MQNIRRSPFPLFLLLGVITGVFEHRTTAQTLEPKGLIIYKSSAFASDESAMAAEYSEIEFHTAIVHGRKVDGSAFRIVASEFVDSIEYPDLKRGIIATPEQIEIFKSAGRKMMDVSAKFSSANAILAPRIEGMKSAADKLNAGLKLINGEFKTDGQLASILATSNKSSPPTVGVNPTPEVYTVEGVRYTNAVATRIGSSQIHLKHENGFAKLDYTEFDDANLDLLFPGHLADIRRREADRVALSEHNQILANNAERDAKLEALIRAQADEIRKAAEENERLAKERRQAEVDLLIAEENMLKLAEQNKTSGQKPSGISEEQVPSLTTPSPQGSSSPHPNSQFQLILALSVTLGISLVIFYILTVRTANARKKEPKRSRARSSRLHLIKLKLKQCLEPIARTLLQPLVWLVVEIGNNFGIVVLFGIFFLVFIVPSCDPSPSYAPRYSSNQLDFNDPAALERFRKKNERDAERHKSKVLRDFTPEQRRVWDAENREALKAF